MATGTRRDTPAQDDNLRRQQTPAQQRNVNQSRIKREQDRANRIGSEQSLTGRAKSAIQSATSNSDNPRPVNANRSGNPQGGPTPAPQHSGSASGLGRDVRDRALSANPPNRQPSGGNPYGGATPAPQHSGSASEFVSSAVGTVGDVLHNTVGRGNPLSPYGAMARRGMIAGGHREDGSAQGNTATADPRDPNRASLDPRAVGGATQAGGSAANMGYWQAEGGPRNYIAGTQQAGSGGGGGLSIMGEEGGFGRAAEELRKANAIRRETLAMQDGRRGAGGRSTTSGGSGGDPYSDQIMAATRAAGNANSFDERLQHLLEAKALRQERDYTLDSRRVAATEQAQQPGPPSGTDIYNSLRAQQLGTEMQQSQQYQGLPDEPPEFDVDTYSGLRGQDPDAAEMYMQDYRRQLAGSQLRGMLQQDGVTLDEAQEAWMSGQLPDDSPYSTLFGELYGQQGDVEEFADGGYVPDQAPMSAMDSASMGPRMGAGAAQGMGSPTANPVNLMQMEYDDYAIGSERLGVPAVPFEQFVELKTKSIPQAPSPQEQGAMMFADGGPVPEMPPQGMGGSAIGNADVSGKMIVDPDPQAPTDSIPAMIDGQRPAALDSGEYVIPKSAVMFHGIDKLNKLIAQAEQQQGQSNGTDG